MNYEIIVVGGGHAGCEAALVSARKGYNTLLITSNINNIADMPCNPAIGGPAKGILVREIDALGGEMGINTDKSVIQIKMLNTKKGPAVQALRAQVDRHLYAKNMQKTLKETKNLTIKEAMVENLIIKDNEVKGIITEHKKEIFANIVILTTGTYLKSSILIGDTSKKEGPHGEKASLHLSDKLQNLGFNILRLKTGTPPRIDKNSINFIELQKEYGDEKEHTFSHTNKVYYDVNNQEICHLIYTTKETHDIVINNIHKSSMYSGLVEGIGPRYCPSIEDKIKRFSDKEKHQLFLEPESLSTNDIYIQGFSTSFPVDIQEKLVKSLPGLLNAKINKYAYAIEYDAIDSKQLKKSLESKIISNLFFAGQINGTSGYEEAAGQGIIAGINATLKIESKEPLILNRNDAYIGVLIDDLVTKGVKDPYRLLTSRAEYRLLLRNDNADIRLSDKGYNVGLLPIEKYNNYCSKINNIKAATIKLKEYRITPKAEINNYLNEIGTTSLKEGISLFELLKRPEVTFEDINYFLNINLTETEKQQITINAKYEGYIKKAKKEAARMLVLEEKKIPEYINYDDIPNLASEARQKLNEIKPNTIGQATRISGVNPADISILLVYLKRNNKHE